MFPGGWYLTGDLATEGVLIEHKAVAEAGATGKPDPVAMEVVKAFVSLKGSYELSDDLRRELLGFARTHLGPVVIPREITFLSTLPKTRSGKLMRRLLKGGESGLPEDETSKLEAGS